MRELRGSGIVVEPLEKGFILPDIKLAVLVEGDVTGRRRVREVLAVTGRSEGGVVETAEVFVTRDGELVRGSGWPPHRDRFVRAGFDLTALLGGGS